MSWSSAPVGLSDQPDEIVPAESSVAEEVTGARPYEMTWAGRREDRPPLVDFEDLAGWKVLTFKGAKARFSRSREQQMWGQFVGKLTYRGTSKESRIVISPPVAVRVSDPFDCVNLWCYGNNWGWVTDPSTPQVELALLIEDSAGEVFRVPLTKVRWKEWWLVHKKIPQEMLDRMRLPAGFAGLEVLGAANQEDRVLYFDSLVLYKEELKPLAFKPRPARNIKPFPGQGHGLNGTGKGRLPFPTRRETILPSNLQKRFRNSIEEKGPGEFELRYDGADAHVVYRYRPRTGSLSDVTVSLNGSHEWLPMKGAGVRFVDEPGQGTLVSAGVKRGSIRAVFQLDSALVEIRLHIMGKSLVLDVFCLGGRAKELSLGTMAGVRNPRLVLVPYLTFGASNPRVLLMDTDRGPAFASVWIDWYRSNGSELYSEDSVRGDEAKINGGVRYIPRTDGKRNDLFERIFLTVSPVFEETLPTIPNPPSPWGRVAGERLWQESWGPEDYAKEHARSKNLRSYGIRKLIQCNHEITWRDGGESFTLRTRAAPGKGGDEGLRRYVTAQRSLGWLCGLYTNYCDYCPVNEYWNEDDVERTPEGEWRQGWPRCYVLKPSRAVERDAELAPIIKRRFRPNSAYTDVHTAVAPWAYCDYDARVPGAGTFASTFYAYGEILLNDQKVYGPTFSEGTYQWLYAGLASGNYGLAYTNVDLSEEPLNVAFDLLKIHPLECDIGMPWTAGFYKKPGWDSPENIDASIDRFIAATIAYGHIGWLVEESHGIRRTCRSYYLIQQVSKRYAMKRPVRMEYADEEGRWLSTSTALATGAIAESKLHVEYPRGFHVFVNWSRTKDWGVRFRRKEYVIPPNGFCALDGRGFFAGSTLVDGIRVDQVVSNEYVYLDGRDRFFENEWLAGKGGLVMEYRRGRSVLIDIGGNDEIGFKADLRGFKLRAYDPAGKLLGMIRPEKRRGKFWFTPVRGARSYRVGT